VPEAYREDLAKVLQLFQEGKITPVIAEVLPLDRATAAHELIENSSISGKIVLTCTAR
jgi:NADPH:quinone reductase-like Zn-dependent oxidoreductase